MLPYNLQGDMARPLLKSIAIDTESIVASQGDEEGILPRATNQTSAFGNGHRLLFQSLCLQGCHPRVNHQSCQVRDNPITGRIGIRPKQFCIVLVNILGHLQHHLGYKVSLLCLYITVDHSHHVKHYIIIMGILVVTMQVPVARLVVYLDIAYPKRSAYLHLRIEEVRTCVSVVQPRVQHFHHPSVSGFQSFQWPHLMSPAIVQ